MHLLYTHHTHTTLSPVLSCARSLRQYTFLTNQASLAIVPFWLWGDGFVAGGFPHRANRYVLVRNLYSIYLNEMEAQGPQVFRYALWGSDWVKNSYKPAQDRHG